MLIITLNEFNLGVVKMMFENKGNSFHISKNKMLLISSYVINYANAYYEFSVCVCVFK